MTRGLEVLAVDDEAPARDDLAHMLHSLPEIGGVKAVSNGTEALRTVAESRFDALFLDVRMPTLDGLELAQKVKRLERPPPIVFVSAYETGAVGAFEVKAVDYLLKPVSSIRLAQAVARVIETLAEETTPTDRLVSLRTARGGTRLVSRESILYLQAQGDYVRIVTDAGRFLERRRITELEERLAGHGFSRVHRGYLANLARAVEVRPQPNGTAKLALSGGQEIPIARRKVSELRRSLRP